MIMNFGVVFQAGFITELMIMLHFSVNAVQNELELPAREGGGGGVVLCKIFVQKEVILSSKKNHIVVT